MFFCTYVGSAYAGLFSKLKKKNNSSASILNSNNFTILRSVFCSRNVCVSNRNICISYIHSWLMLLFLLVFAVRISLLLLFFFFSRGARGHAVVIVNDSFSDLPFFGSEESAWSEITNPFLDSPQKTQGTQSVFAGGVLSNVSSPLSREDPADKVGHFMCTYIETLLRGWWRCRSDFEFKLVSSKISFLLSR